MKRIQSKLNKFGPYVCKISLSYFDDKRYTVDDGILYLIFTEIHVKLMELNF